MKKAFFAAMLIVLGLFVALGVGLFAQGAYEHRNRPLVSLDHAGVQACLEAPASLRAAADIFHAFV